MDLQYFIKTALISVVTFFVSAYPLHTQANSLGVERGEICAATLSSDFTACPQIFTDHALSMSYLHSETTECESSGPMCIGDNIAYQSKTDYFTFFDVDNAQTVKYEITIHPNVYDPMGNLVMPGNKSAVEIQPTNHEVEATETLAEIAELRQSIVKKFTLEMDEYGNVTDATGQSASTSLENAVELCLTALDYTSTDVNCAGSLNTDIDNAVVNDAGFHAFISAVTKLEGVINFISPLNMELSSLKNLSTFRVKIEYADGSVLVVDVTVKEGVVEIVLNKDASRTSENRTFTQAESQGTSSQSSLREAKRVASSKDIPKQCEPTTFVNTDWVVVEVITTVYPDGRTEVTNIYRKQDSYITYLQC